MRCRLAFSSSTRDSPSLEALFRRCRELGYDGLLLGPAQYGVFLGDPAGFLGRWAEFAPLAIGLSVAGDVRSERARRHFEQVVDLAVGIDGDLLVLCGDGPPLSGDGGAADATIRRLRALADAVRGKGLRLSVSNQADGLVASRRDCEILTGAAGPDILHLTFDTAQFLMAGETDLASLAREFHRYLDHVALTDVAQSRFPTLEGWRFAMRRLGEGDIDFRPLLEALEALDFAGWLTVEDVPADAHAAENMARGAAFLRRHWLAEDS